MERENRRPKKYRAVAKTKRYVSPRTKGILALCLLAVLAIGAGVFAFTQGWIHLPEIPTEDPQESTAAQLNSKDTVIHLVAGGDINITDKVVASGGANYDYSDVFLDILPVLTRGDLTLANFEGNVCGAPYGTAMRSAPTQLLQALRSAGVDVLQTANSHAITNGLRGLAATKNAIKAAGMQSVGTYADEADFQRYQGFLMYEVQGIRIAVVAFTKGMDGRNLPEGSEDCVNLLYTDYSSTYKEIDKEGITRVLRAVEREKPDLTVAMLHWGSEFNDRENATQGQIIELMSQLGVDAIIGNHPHHVQKIGFDSKTGIFVAYSLGDFLGDGETANTSYTVLLDLQITKDGKTGKTRITGWEYTPVYLQYSQDGQLRLLRIREAMAAYEADYIGKVPKDVYDAMKTALSRIESRVNG